MAFQEVKHLGDKPGGVSELKTGVGRGRQNLKKSFQSLHIAFHKWRQLVLNESQARSQRRSKTGEVIDGLAAMIDDSNIEIKDLEEISARWYNQFLKEMRGWRIVLDSLAATVLLVGGVGVLSVMLISFSDRRFEIGLRKAMGASDGEILVQFLLEATVLAALGSVVGTVAGTIVCRMLSPMFPWGLVVNPLGLLVAWLVALSLAVVFGLYPAIRASRLSPMEAMR